MDMNSLVNIYSPYELYHHGILGQKWGVKNGPPYPLSNNEFDLKDVLKKSKSSNVESWGKDENHNILYITGYSGSGKSTIAKQLSDKNVNVIHLDSYFQSNDLDKKDKDFLSFLNKKMPDYKTIRSKKHSEEWIENLHKFTNIIEDFSKIQYKNNKKVIVEGVQISDSILYPNKKFFINKSLIIVGTNKLTSAFRASSRDNEKMKDIIGNMNVYIKWHKQLEKSLKELSKTTSAKKGQDFLDKYYNRR